MISKIILCKKAQTESDATPNYYLCSAIVIFKKDLPISHGYCEFYRENEDIYIHSKGWSIPKESLIRTIQIYVRNKLEDILTGQIITLEAANKKAESILRKQGRYYVDDFDIEDLPPEIIEQIDEFPEEMKEEILQLEKKIQEITNRVNASWKQ